MIRSAVLTLCSLKMVLLLRLAVQMNALIEVFKDKKKKLELLLKYSRVIFLESSKVWSHFRSSLKSIKLRPSQVPISALWVQTLFVCNYLSYIKYPDMHSVMHKHYFKEILKCSLFKE